MSSTSDGGAVLRGSATAASSVSVEVEVSSGADGGAGAGAGAGGASASAQLAPTNAKPPPEAPMDAAYVRRVLPALSLWLCMSISVILFNKFLFVTVFRFPLTLCCLHMLFATCLTQLLRAAGRLPVPAIGWDPYLRAVVPLGVMYACSLSSSNLAANRLTVSFIQMIKAVTPMMTLAVSVAYGTEQAHRSLVIITTMMTLGVGCASYGEVEFDGAGLALQLTALTVESVRLVAMQRMGAVHLPRSNPLVALSLFAPLCFAFLLPVALFLEPRALAVLADAGSGAALPVLLNTCTAFGLNYAVVLLVNQESGPLTLTLAGIIKDIALIVSSIFLFGNPITYTQVAGYTLALYGLNCYHRVKAGKNAADGPIGPLLRDSASDKVMFTMAAGLGVLLLFAVPG